MFISVLTSLSFEIIDESPPNRLLNLGVQEEWPFNPSKRSGRSILFLTKHHHKSQVLLSTNSHPRKALP